MFDGYIRDHARWSPRATAVLTPQLSVPYARFDADIDRFGAALRALGVTPDTGVVSVCLDDPYLTYLATAALARLRVVSAPFNDPGADIRLIQRAGAGDDSPGPRLVMLDADWIAAMRAAAPRALPVLEIDPDAVGRVMLSSGSTRTARRIAFTWRRIEACNLASLCSRTAGAHGTYVSLTTIEAMQGFNMAVAAWSVGAALGGGFNAAMLPRLLETAPPGVIGCTPIQLSGILDALPTDFRPQPAWRISIGGSRLSPALARDARLRLTPEVWVTFGATEHPLIAMGHAADLEEDPGLMGVAQPGVWIEIVDEDGVPVPDGQSGELRLRGPRTADGYLDDPQSSAERFRDGAFYTRDIGRRLPDGRIVLEGRADDRMNLGGRKFMPAILEEAALACPGVRDAAAFAVPDDAGLDVCWLAVRADPGFDRASLAAHLAGYRDLPPPRFAWVDEIPRNVRGKIQRDRLREALQAAIAAGAGDA